MKCFLLDSCGDVVIEKNDISLVYDSKLQIQKLTQVMKTNRGEWWLNEKEGIPRRKILKKNPNLAAIKDYMRSAVAQVDKSMKMTGCNIAVDRKNRHLTVTFKVQLPSGEEVTAETEV